MSTKFSTFSDLFFSHQTGRLSHTETFTLSFSYGRPPCINRSRYGFRLNVFVNCLLNPLLYDRCNLRCLHIFVFFIIERFHKMNLHSDRPDWICIKRFKGIYQSHRNNRTLCLGRRLKASAFKVAYLVSLFWPGSLSKNKIVSSFSS